MSSALKICPTCGTEYPANERFCPRDGTALRSQGNENDLVGSMIAERYHVLKKLGEGGMGQVYLAEHVKMGRKSAVKVMNPGMVHDADAISRFNREAANASRINHPNVAGIYDFGETADGLIYLAMEFIEGESLTSLVERTGALPAIRAAEITRQVAEGLNVAHDMGIVHRDLKPDNIMIAKSRDGSDCVKVVDFGIAKAAGAENQKVTKTGLVVGTPEYMSPEQLAGDKLDGRSDIYSLGLVTFNMLTGSLPFRGESAQESMIMRLTDEPATLATVKPDVAWPAEVQMVMARALARKAADRYQDASRFGRELYMAVERMPASSAATAGTAVMSAPTAAMVAMAAVPATRVADRNLVESTPAVMKRSRAPVYAGGSVAAAGLLIAALVWFPRSTSQTGGVVAAPATDSAATQAGVGATSELPAPGATLSRDTTAVAASVPRSTNQPLPTTANGAGGAVRTPAEAPVRSESGDPAPSYTEDIDGMLQTVLAPGVPEAEAGRVLQRAQRLRATTASRQDVAGLTLVEGLALTASRRVNEGCQRLEKVNLSDLAMSMRKELKDALDACKS